MGLPGTLLISKVGEVVDDLLGHRPVSVVQVLLHPAEKLGWDSKVETIPLGAGCGRSFHGAWKNRTCGISGPKPLAKVPLSKLWSPAWAHGRWARSGMVVAKEGLGIITCP